MFGLGLRHKHHKYVLNNKPELDFFEIHTENFIAEGGASLNFLRHIKELYPLSFHCVGLSLGSADGVNKEHVKNIKNLIDQFKPILISDHISWSNSTIATANDLLPIPYTKNALQVFCDNVKHVQDIFGQAILVENPSAYLQYNDSEMSEVEFINNILLETDCDLLLDINNVFVTAQNFGLNAINYLNEINHDKVREIHLAGHSIFQHENKQIRIDTHNTNICDEVLELYKFFIKKTTRQIPTLIEWDSDIPEFETLFTELTKVKALS